MKLRVLVRYFPGRGFFEPNFWHGGIAIGIAIGIDQIVESVIIKERPDGVMVSMGGQTALNCGVALHNKGVRTASLPKKAFAHRLLLEGSRDIGSLSIISNLVH